MAGGYLPPKAGRGESKSSNMSTVTLQTVQQKNTYRQTINSIIYSIGKIFIRHGRILSFSNKSLWEILVAQNCLKKYTNVTFISKKIYISSSLFDAILGDQKILISYLSILTMSNIHR